MKLRSVVLASFISGLLVGLPASGSSHNVNDYPASGWKYTITNRVFYHSPNEPTNWPNGWTARTNDAMDHWNAVSSMSLTRSLGGPAPQNIWSCGESFDFIAKGNISNGAIAQTTLCEASNSTVRIKMNDDKTFYKGSNTPNPALEWDVQGIITHELGHAIQAWGDCTNGADEDPCPGSHYDSSINGLICDDTQPAKWSTLCQPSGDFALPGFSWRIRTLEEHDEDLAQAMY